MALADAPDFLTMEETAEILRIGRNQVYELARVWRATDGERGVPVVEFGRRLRVPKGGAAAPGRTGCTSGRQSCRLYLTYVAWVWTAGLSTWDTDWALTRCWCCWIWRRMRPTRRTGS